MFVKCISCGSERLEPGRLKGMDDPALVPQNARYLATGSHVKTSVQACADCGLVMFSVDPDELNTKANVGGATEIPSQTASSAQNKLEPGAGGNEPELEVE